MVLAVADAGAEHRRPEARRACLEPRGMEPVARADLHALAAADAAVEELVLGAGARRADHVVAAGGARGGDRPERARDERPGAAAEEKRGAGSASQPGAPARAAGAAATSARGAALRTIRRSPQVAGRRTSEASPLRRQPTVQLPQTKHSGGRQPPIMFGSAAPWQWKVQTRAAGAAASLCRSASVPPAPPPEEPAEGAEDAAPEAAAHPGERQEWRAGRARGAAPARSAAARGARSAVAHRAVERVRSRRPGGPRRAPGPRPRTTASTGGPKPTASPRIRECRSDRGCPLQRLPAADAAEDEDEDRYFHRCERTPAVGGLLVARGATQAAARDLAAACRAGRSSRRRSARGRR